jgi:lipopolysaccharide/colanic/teichoic acid biosynthesis glycosyltransferase
MGELLRQVDPPRAEDNQHQARRATRWLVDEPTEASEALPLTEDEVQALRDALHRDQQEAVLREVQSTTLEQSFPQGAPWAAMEPRRSWLALKRVIDVVLGTVLALLALPVILVVALGAWIQLRESPFFLQRRVGRDGRSFLCPKIRTLPSHTPVYATKYELNLDVQGFTGFLRKHHLDELPQLLVVPFGRLSLVGPRPKMPDEYEPVPEWYSTMRSVVPPGCTGLWQIGTHRHLMPHESPQYDLFYRCHGNLRLDLWVMWRTTLRMFRLAGPVNLSRVPSWALQDLLVGSGTSPTFFQAEPEEAG